MTTTFSVCIPTFNRAELLRHLIQSMETDIAQFGERIQIVVSDNASTDGTAAMCRELQERGINLKYIRQPKNIGPDRNFLAAVNGADGEYSLLMGDDDAIRPGLFAFLEAAVQQARPDVFISDRILCDKDLKPTGVQKVGRSHLAMKLFDFADRGQQLDYLGRVDSFIGIFSFLSTIGFRTAAWRRTEDYPDSIGTAYSHVYKLMDILVKQRGKLLYLPETTILARLGNDSFLQALDNSTFRRWQLDFVGYGTIAKLFYPADAELRRAFLSPVFQILHPGTRAAYLQMAAAENRSAEALSTLELLDLAA